jgi:TolB protein
VSGFAPVVVVMMLAAALLVSCGGDNNDEPPEGAAPESLIVYEGAKDGAVNVYTVDAETGTIAQLTFRDSSDAHPAWSPDRTRIVFASDRDDASGERRRDIYTMAADGSDVRRVTELSESDDWSPKYSRNGERIAFTTVRDGEYSIALMNADGSGVRTLAGPYSFAEFPAWSPDGNEIYFSAIADSARAADIFAVPVDGGDPRTVISTPDGDVCPHFTRDGRYMAYASTRPAEGQASADNYGAGVDVLGEQGEEPAQPDIFVHDLETGDTSGASDTRLTDHPSRDDYSNPSPDGSGWVFLSHRAGQPDLWLMHRDGTNQRALTNTPDIRENVPDW